MTVDVRVDFGVDLEQIQMGFPFCTAPEQSRLKYSAWEARAAKKRRVFRLERPTLPIFLMFKQRLRESSLSRLGRREEEIQVLDGE